MVISIESLSIAQAHEKLKNKEISARQLTEESLKRIDALNEKLNMFVYVNREYALSQAEKIDKEGDFNNPLKGIPYSLKDNFCSSESPSTASSKILEKFISPYEATVVIKLREAGAILLGKTNTDEFTMGSSTETSYYGVTRNPWDPSRVAGGSSGGPVAAVAAGMGFFSLGTDTGGSIRQPSALCGMTGLKVTYGRTSRFGVMSMASSLDTIGPIGKTVEDVAIIMNVIAGHDPHDSTTPDKEVPDYTQFLQKDIRGLKIGIPKEYFIKGMQPEVEEAVKQGISKMKELGASIIDVSLPYTKYVLPVYYVIAPLEVSSNMARYDGIRYGLKQEESKDLLDHYFKVRSRGFGKEVKRKILIGTYIHSLGYDGAYYIKAQKVRTLLMNDYQKVFSEVDVLVMPSTPATAFVIGEKNKDPVQMYLEDIFTVSANLVGIPSMSIPCGFDSHGLPIGMQIAGKQFAEDIILRVADAYQRSTEWHRKTAKASLLEWNQKL